MRVASSVQETIILTMTVLEVADLPSITIPDTVEQLRELWNDGTTIDLLGNTYPRFRRTRDIVLTTWSVRLEDLPATLTWEADMRCEVTGFRVAGGDPLPFDDLRRAFLERGDILRLSLRP